LNLRPPGYEPGELPGCSTPRRGADCSTAVTIALVDWTIYGALIGAFLAVVGAAAFLGVRVLQGWRALKRLRRHVGRELHRLADLGEQTSESLAHASDQTELAGSLARLRVALARFAVLRTALDEATATFGRIAAVYPRK
jgi:hypothetical protein